MPPSPFSALPPIDNVLRLHLNAFRGEPAISEFDWHFTSTHSSSRDFAPSNGSDLHLDIIQASPWPWVAHPVSGQIPATYIALFGLAFAMAPQVSLLNLATKIHSPAHSSIGTPSSRPKAGPRRFVGTRFQELLTPLPGCFFTFPSRYCCTIGHWRCLALESGLTSFPRDSSCPVVLKNTDQVEPHSFTYEAVTLFGGPFQGPSVRAGLGNYPAGLTARPACVLQPPQGIGP